MVRAVLTGRSTGSDFDLALFSSLSSERLRIFSLHAAIHIYIYIGEVFGFVLFFT